MLRVMGCQHTAAARQSDGIYPDQVYNKRGQQEELLGHAELSISTFLKNTGQVNDATINLTYGEQLDAGQV